MSKLINRMYVYTDGACQGNPGPGGWSAIIKSDDRKHYQELSGCELHTTNNRMELTAAIQGLAAIQESSEVILTSDSKYVVDAIQKGWLTKWKSNGWRSSTGTVKNIDLWETLDDLLIKHHVTSIWVKGHSGYKENERCDQLAKRAIAGLCNFS